MTFDIDEVGDAVQFILEYLHHKGVEVPFLCDHSSTTHDYDNNVICELCDRIVEFGGDDYD